MTTPVLERPTRVLGRPPVLRERRMWVFVLIALVVAAAATVTAVLLTTGGESKAQPSAAAFRIADSYSWMQWVHRTPQLAPTQGSAAAFRIADVQSLLTLPPAR